MKLKLDAAAEKRLKDSIKRQVGKVVEKVVGDCLEEVVKATPMNTGRTLASWDVNRGSPSNYDAEQDFPGQFSYDPLQPPSATNHLPVGSEPDRDRWQIHAMNSILDVEIAKAPYDTFYISNGAHLDSMFDSFFPDFRGSRAGLMDSGAIPGYDVYHGKENVFDPRGVGFFRLAISKFLSKVKRRRR